MTPNAESENCCSSGADDTNIKPERCIAEIGLLKIIVLATGLQPAPPSHRNQRPSRTHGHIPWPSVARVCSRQEEALVPAVVGPIPHDPLEGRRDDPHTRCNVTVYYLIRARKSRVNQATPKKRTKCQKSALGTRINTRVKEPPKRKLAEPK